ncbi:tRNA(His) 5'-end guanylyltransferase [Amycolatopsis lurida]|uniref:tRNA(His) guanylyltransferase n=1 Tax=Amycolatopsis lurida NRRL 2430 TaxID=1460371 RepID=A0A2P2FQI4_AMYLU|nr:tRNA(His) guanylyltransferase Thg1 family protein [Amycolatopsis lurida]KFU78967.1 tRNA 5'-guanylyltransferase [Amycolatopsis lurida NRRL 2430]SED84847.1 tRNA(His) 5'-end guanylyltransferase [Amycolatopsis lurida]
MDAGDFEARQREREWFHGLTVPPGAWTVLRVDGRGFSKFTEARFEKPFDPRFADCMAEAAGALLSEFASPYVYTESDEISLVLAPSADLFGRGVEKLVSISAGIASAAFTHAAGVPAHFDGRVWLGTTLDDVVDYFSWRQADAARCALNGWCYWILRKAGKSASEAGAVLDGAGVSEKNELLFAHGVNFAEVPSWQRRGVGLYWESYERTGFDPVREVEVSATRRRVRVERELPMKDEYRAFLGELLQPIGSGSRRTV